LEKVSQNSSNGRDQAKTSIEIWDLGAGSGRDVCFLAEELKYHFLSVEGKEQRTAFRIVAMDQRYRSKRNPQSSTNSNSTTARLSEQEECQSFWTRRRVGGCIECMEIDLMNSEAQETVLKEMAKRALRRPAGSETTEKRLLVIVAVRFWNRSLVENFISQGLKDLIHSHSTQDIGSPTIIFAISQFGKPSLGAPWEFEHPKEKHVLERTELSNLFTPRDAGQSGTWQILHDRVVADSDHGRTLIQFVAESSSRSYSN